MGEGQFSFRTSGDVEQGVLDRFEQQVGRWIAMYRELSREQGHPPRWLGYKLNLSSHSSFEDAQAAGEAAVDLWALGPRPAERLRSAMEERLRILVLQVDAPAGVSGAASRVHELSCAFVNRQESEGRRNFDLAHELFHLLTWDALPPPRTAAADATRRGKQWRVEKLAENFAAALLMPEEIVRCHWESRAPLANLHDRINKVAAYLKVSAQACKWRLYNLGLLSAGDLERIEDRRLSRDRGRRCSETGPLRFSSSFMKRVAVAINGGRLSVKRAASLLGLSVEELAGLLGAHGHKMYFEA